jgi:hypothetical protein
MKVVNAIRVFGMTHQLIEADLDSIEARLSIDLGRNDSAAVQFDEDYFLQFAQELRRDASEMSQYYEVFYCLENSLRLIIGQKLLAEVGANWWADAVPVNVKESAAKNLQRELDSGVTARSPEPIAYTTFGELGEIVKANWGHFNDTFNSQSAFNRIMAILNTLRGPIAHCAPLADDEVARLKLTLRDWYRLME